MCIFEVLTGYTGDGGYEKPSVYMLMSIIIIIIIIIIKDNVTGSLAKYHPDIHSTSYMNVSGCTKTTSKLEARTLAVGQSRT